MSSHESRLAFATITKLTTEYGFDPTKARDAVNAIGDKGDVELAISWLLDHGEEDRGGAIALKHCPHLDHSDQLLVAPSALSFGCGCFRSCAGSENWVCLVCGETHCSRYVNQHALAHWNETRDAAARALTVGEAASGKEALGHHVALSLSDLSVWCYQCSAYVEHDRLAPLIEAMRRAKFGEPGPRTKNKGAEPTGDGAVVRVGDAHSGTRPEMHGTLGDPEWAPPRVVAVSAEMARPGYRTCAAHEYEDEPHVLAHKVELLASMLKTARHPVAYTGAGISTAAGVSDYASKAGTLRADSVDRVDPLEAQPTRAHHVLTALHRAGMLTTWVQQNHDGLPQKAGFPQAAINEIHGAWFDPSNPVVPMDGDLRPDLISALLETEERADLCVVAGTSLCGMNADRIASTTARRARGGEAGVQGTVLINLQRTVMDASVQLRIFAGIDTVMAMLARSLALPEGGETLPAGPPGGAEGQEDVFELPYSGEGRLARDSQPRIRLDLRPGARVRLVDQPAWDKERCGDVATVEGRNADGHFVIRMPFGGGCASRLLGSWWVQAALEGCVASIPVVPVAQADEHDP